MALSYVQIDILNNKQEVRSRVAEALGELPHSTAVDEAIELLSGSTKILSLNTVPTASLATTWFIATSQVRDDDIQEALQNKSAKILSLLFPEKKDDFYEFFDWLAKATSQFS